MISGCRRFLTARGSQAFTQGSQACKTYATDYTLVHALDLPRLQSERKAAMAISRFQRIQFGAKMGLVNFPKATAVTVVCTWLFSPISPEKPPLPLGHDLGEDLFVRGFFCPLGEEIVFRGLLQNMLLRVPLLPPAAILTTQAFFADVHTAAFPMGKATSIMLLPIFGIIGYTHGLPAAIATHAVHNISCIATIHILK